MPQDSSTSRQEACLLGIDVGTGSARAGLFNLAGKMLATDKRDITLWREGADIAEQSSEQIWSAVCDAVKGAVAKAGIDASQVAGIGFDATCSLVVVGENGAPLPAGRSGDPQRNIIVWMDHRAIKQAERINATGHKVLDYVGGAISPEMETPKLLWLKENLPDTYHAAWQFFDLADFLSWRATGDLARSTCTVTCKWTYLAHESRWDADYFRTIGLEDLPDRDFAPIGQKIVPPGTPLTNGLSTKAATELGLPAGIPVGAGLIDAHAGGIGTVGAEGKAEKNLAYVFGTSSCTMTTTSEPVFIPGVWGPYFQAMVPGMWLNEGGQSAAGAAIDQLLSFHPAVAEATKAAAKAGRSLPGWLAERARAAVTQPSDVVTLARGIHVVPEFLGNRAPFADPHARALIAGLGMEQDIDSLMALYISGICGIGYGLRQILETQDAAGARIERIMISGGAGQDALIRQLLADAAGRPVHGSGVDEPVLLGTAILGACASGLYRDIPAAMGAMSKVSTTYTVAGGTIGEEHETRYQAFLSLQETARKIRHAG